MFVIRQLFNVPQDRRRHFCSDRQVIVPKRQRYITPPPPAETCVVTMKRLVRFGNRGRNFINLVL
jgi:hypothetical protein